MGGHFQNTVWTQKTMQGAEHSKIKICWAEKILHEYPRKSHKKICENSVFSATKIKHRTCLSDLKYGFQSLDRFEAIASVFCWYFRVWN